MRSWRRCLRCAGGCKPTCRWPISPGFARADLRKFCSLRRTKRIWRSFWPLSMSRSRSIRSGSGPTCLSGMAARFALDNGIGGLTFLRGIPGTIGGALRMNGGAYGGETKDVLVEARAIDRRGRKVVLSNKEMGFGYRHCSAPEGLIFTAALLQGQKGDPAGIAAAMQDITSRRESTQPVKTRTGGATFKNPPGAKAWQLIDKAGLRGFSIGAAKVSELHCNFLINDGGATAAQLEELGETVRRRVRESSGVELEWEIKRIGAAAE